MEGTGSSYGDRKFKLLLSTTVVQSEACLSHFGPSTKYNELTVLTVLPALLM